MNDTSSLIGAVALFAGLTIFFTLYAIWSPINTKKRQQTVHSEDEEDLFAVMVDPLEGIEGEEAARQRDDNNQAGLLKALLKGFSPAIPSFLNSKQQSKLKIFMHKAGNPWNMTPEELIASMLIVGIGLALLGASLCAFFAPSYIFLGIFMGAMMGYMPYAAYNNAKTARTRAIEKELPGAMDLLTITINSNQTFTTSLGSVANRLPDGVLKKEFMRVYLEIQAGASLTNSLVAFAQRFDSMDVESFVRAVVQSEKLGSNITDTLEQQSDFIRANYENRIEKMVNRLETTLFVPLLLFIIPAFLIVILAPALENILTGLL